MASAKVLDQAIEFLCATFDKRIDDARRTIYSSLLEDLPDDILKAAVKHCASTNTFFPVPGEIRAAAAHLGKLSNRVPSGDEAWSELVNRAHAPRSIQQVCPECFRLEAENSRLTEEITAAVWARDHALHDKLLIELNLILRTQHSRRACPDCETVTIEYRWSHPLVGEVAHRLGWPARFWSDTIGVDRGRFIKTYESEMERRTGESILLPAVREYVDDQRALLDDRSAAFDTGEQKQINAQYHALARSMEY
jgi:hypothetical protein